MTEHHEEPDIPASSTESRSYVLATLERLWELIPLPGNGKASSKASYLPKTTPKRRRESIAKPSLETDDHLPEHLPEKLSHQHDGAQPRETTVLYLAYGSNLNSKTFLGRRGIKPLSQINVMVPELRLTFDLPGLPYAEPCFAATQFRKVPNKDTKADKTQTSESNSPDIDNDSETTMPLLNGQGKQTEGEEYHPSHPLIGVVYEVTLSDYARIIATEGGGRGYKDVIVSCYPFPQNYKSSDPIPSDPTGTTSFKAHTLLSPFTTAKMSQTTTDSEECAVPHPSKYGLVSRPEGYAQPSQRYLNLIINGAAEHDLPVAYRRYLDGVQAYKVTSVRQMVGKSLFLISWGPMVLTVLFASRAFAGPDGHSPGWLVRWEDFVLTSMWRVYDGLFVAVFGDGERTIDKAKKLR